MAFLSTLFEYADLVVCVLFLLLALLGLGISLRDLLASRLVSFLLFMLAFVMLTLVALWNLLVIVRELPVEGSLTAGLASLILVLAMYAWQNRRAKT